LWLLPIFQSIHYLLGDCLSGSGYQSSRALLELSAVGVNVALNVVLIPRYLASGAAIATILTEALLAFAMFFYVGLLLRRSRKSSTDDVYAA
jgi:O-antigen/teichoic acid export membrane protein